MDGAGDEVPTKPQHEVVDGGIQSLDFHQTEGDLEEVLDASLGDAEVEGVEAVHRSREDGFLDVPVACEDKGCGLRNLPIKGLDLVGVRSNRLLGGKLTLEGLVGFDEARDCGLVVSASGAFLVLFHRVVHLQPP